MTQAIDTVSFELTDNEWCALVTLVVRDGDGVGLDAAVFRDIDGNRVRVMLLRADLHALARFVGGDLPSPRSPGWDVMRVGFLAFARDKIVAATSAL
jgi:hypothetical protein